MHSRLRLPLAAAFFGTIAMLVLVITPTMGSGAAGITYTFDGAPASPKAFNPADWDVAVSSRNTNTFYAPETMHALHGADCGAPPLTHEVSTYEQSVFQCKDHVMTAIQAEGYGVIYLTPNHMVDFSQGEAVVKWDVSTFRTTYRDFLDFWITPFELNQQLPMDDWLPDGQGEPKEAIHIRMDGQPGSTMFRGAIVKNHVVQELPSDWWTVYESLLTPDQKVRTTFELRITKTSLKFGIPSLNLWWIDTTFADLGWSQGVFQMGHHSYNPWKDGDKGPNTWHFDNVSISPAIPFTMLKGNVRFVDTQNQVVQFNGAAPAGSKLRFSAVGTIDVSYDNGATWQAAQRQKEEYHLADHFSSYWTPIPAGATQVMFRGGPDAWFERWLAKDFGVWSLNSASSAPAPTNTPLPSTNTAVPPTATVAAATNTPVAPTATATAPAATATKTTAVATATATKTTVPPTATATAQANPQQVLSQPGTRVEWLGEGWYLHGVNLPWYNWGCDFGCNSNGGASSTTVKNALAPRFQTLEDSAVHNVRWWLFPGDPWQITRDSSGAPTGINPAVYADLDAALAMAETYDLYYTFAIFSSPSHIPAAWLTDPAQREKLSVALGGLFARYAGNPRILAWDVVNEPEFDIWGGKANQADVQSLVRSVATQVHQRGGGSLVTVGGAMLDGLPMWVGLGLDFHSPHWYDYMSSGNWCARCTTYDALKVKYNLDAPVVLGEVYTGNDSDAAARHADFYDKGYAGSWSWSLFPERTADLLSINMTAAAAFAAAKTDDGPGGLSGSVTQPTPTRTATTVPATATPTRTATTVPATATPTRTATMVPATATPTRTATTVPATATPTRTSTPVQPTATATSTPRVAESTPTKTASPTTTAPTATPTQAATNSTVTKWITTAVTNPATGARRGSLATITTSVTANGTASGLVDMEIYDANGNLVLQRIWDNRTFTPNLKRRFSTTWRIPMDLAPGTYTIKVGVFSQDWGTLYSWNDNAGVIRIK